MKTLTFIMTGLAYITSLIRSLRYLMMTTLDLYGTTIMFLSQTRRMIRKNLRVGGIQMLSYKRQQLNDMTHLYHLKSLISDLLSHWMTLNTTSLIMYYFYSIIINVELCRSMGGYQISQHRLLKYSRY